MNTSNIYKRFGILAASVVLLGLLATVFSYFLVGSYSKYIVNDLTLPANDQQIGIVFGGGVENGKPRPLLKDRLDTAAQLLQSKKVRKLLVSGDNRFSQYNEPDVMFRYLTQEKGVAPSSIQLDNAGRSTYETCERAAKVFQLKEAILVTESTHIARAIYLCRSFGIETYGYSSDGQSSAGLKVGQRFREILARTKATLNVHIIGEKTVLGETIKL